MNTNKCRWFFAPLLVVVTGCLYFGPDITTATPTAEQVAGCRRVMHLDPQCGVTPLGFKLTSGIDDAVWFKFIADVKAIDKVFNVNVVDTSTFEPGFSFVGDNAGMPTWWDAPGKQLIGEGNIELPNVRFMNVGYLGNGDETLTVYIMWHEV